MRRPRKSLHKSSPTSIQAGERGVVVGRDVTHSTIVTGDNVHVHTSRIPLSPDRIANLTEEYKRAVAREWAVLRVNEAEIPLSDAYVMLQAIESPPNSEEKLLELAELPERMKNAGFEPKKTLPIPVELSEALKEAPYLILLGEPGSGKSTTLQFIGLCFAHMGWSESRLHISEERIPIKLDLQRYAEILAMPGRAMEQALHRSVQEYLRDAPEEEVTELIFVWRDQGLLLVLLDGLDEVSDKFRGAVQDEIQKFATWMAYQHSRLIVSARLVGYSTIGGEFKEFMLKPFENPEEAIPYLQSWLHVLRPDWKPQDAHLEALNLHRRMNTQPALRRVLDNPLLLRISAQVYIRDKQIATGRADLYFRYIEELWMRALDRGVERAKKDDVWKNLENIAWSLQTNTVPSIPTEMEIIAREKMGLLVQVDRRLAFSHTTVQEYFVAHRLERAWKINPHRVWAFLRHRLHAAAWREPLLLLCGRLDAKDADKLVRLVMYARSPYERHLYRDKLLAATMLKENTSIDASIRKMGIRCLLQAFKDDSGNAGSAAARLLGELKAVESARELLRAVKDNYWSMRIPAAMALGRIGKEVAPDLIQMLNHDNEDVREMAMLALVQMGTEAVPDLVGKLADPSRELRSMVVEALRQIEKKAESDPGNKLKRERIASEDVQDLILALKREDWRVAKAAALALGKIKASEAVPYLVQALEREDWRVAKAAALALGEIKALEAVHDLIMMEKRWNLREVAIKALGEIQAVEAIPALVSALQDKDSNIHRSAAEALGKIGKDAVPSLILALKNQERSVRRAAERALRQIKATDVVPILLNALDEENREVRRVVTQVLDQIGEDAVLNLIWASRNKDVSVQAVKGNALEYINAADSIPILTRALQHQDKGVREAAAETLREIGKDAVPNLMPALDDEDWGVRMIAVIGLAQMGNVVVPDLIRMLKDKKAEVQRLVIKVLTQIGEGSVSDLIRTLNSENPDVRVTAAKLLGEIKAVEAVPHLMRAFKDEDENMRLAAIRAITEMRGVEASPHLILALKDPVMPVRSAAVEALGKIKAAETLPDLFQVLKDDRSLRSVVDEAIKKIILSIPIPSNKTEQKEQIRLLRHLMKSRLNYDDELLIAERLAVIEADSYGDQDPFGPVKPFWAAFKLNQ
jgi:HEAT repeat protein